jgi:hypothetical protein
MKSTLLVPLLVKLIALPYSLAFTCFLSRNYGFCKSMKFNFQDKED